MNLPFTGRKEETYDYTDSLERFEVIKHLQQRSDHYRLQSLVWHDELVKANKALQKRCRQVKSLRAKIAHHKL